MAHDYFLTIAPIWRDYFTKKIGADQRDTFIRHVQRTKFAHLFKSTQQSTGA